MNSDNNEVEMMCSGETRIDWLQFEHLRISREWTRGFFPQIFAI